MKTLIVYSSQTGNTKKMAEALNDAISGENTLCPVGEAPDPSGFDLLAVGFWLMGGKPDPKSADYLAKVGDANLFLFATHGADANSDHAANAMKHAASLAASATIAGTFSCQGEVNPTFLEKAQKKDPPPPWIGDAPAAEGHPDGHDTQRLNDALNAALSKIMI